MPNESKERYRQVPASALNLTVGEFELGDNGDGAKSAPFRMVARSGRSIYHWYWGRVVHDLDGMQLGKSRVPIDYAHNDGEILGYANRFDTSERDLVATGALVPFKDSDRATEVIHKAKAGVPYEASINFAAPIKLQELREGESTEVNGFEFSGPGVVIREWTLRGIAVCPYGADANTSTEFSGGRKVTVEFLGDTDMAEVAKVEQDVTATTEDNQPESETTLSVVDDNAEADLDKAEALTAESVAVEAEPVAVTLTDRAKEGKRFLEAFGDRGGRWFAEGKSFEEATGLYIKDLESRVEELTQRLGSDGLGEQTPVAFSAEKTKKTRSIRFAGG